MPLLSARRPFRARLRLEILEDRCVPATLMWIANPAGNDDWATAANWVNTLTGANAAPTKADSVLIDPGTTITIGGVNYTGTGGASEDNIAGLSLTDFTIKSGYKGTVTLTNPLTVTGTFDFQGGKLAGQGMTIAPKGTFNWGCATLATNLTVGTPAAKGTVLISGLAGRRLEAGVTLNLYADTTWSEGDISFGNGANIINNAGSTFTVSGGNSYSMFYSSAAGPNGNPSVPTQFTNKGAFIRATGSQTVAFAVPFKNDGGEVRGKTGVVAFRKGYEQTSGTMVLDGGIFATPYSDLTLSGGTLTGSGTILGGVKNSGATVQPGGATPGKITIMGNYTQLAGGKYAARIAKDGTPSVIDVQKNGRMGGRATISGTLTVDKNADYKPPVGTQVEILKSARTVGKWTTTTYTNNSWANGANPKVRFRATMNARGSRLLAEVPPAPPAPPAGGGSGTSFVPDPTLVVSTTGDPTDPPPPPPPPETDIEQSPTQSWVSGPGSVQAGQPITFTVSVSAPGDPLTEALIFDGDTCLGTVALTASGPNSYTGAYTTSSLEPGAHSITATFEGDDTRAPGWSDPLAVSVTVPTPLDSSLILAASRIEASSFELVTFSADLTAAGLATGTVAFYDGGTLLGYADIDANGHAELDVSDLPVGVHSISAVYLGDADFNSSTALPLDLTMLS